MEDDPAERLRAALIVVRRARAQIEALARDPETRPDDLSLRDLAEALQRDRRQRERHFPPALFGEPVWDLLLALFIARADGVSLNAAEACEAARVKRSAGRRLIAMMEAQGLIERIEARLRLTDAAAGRLTDYLVARGN